MLLLRRRLPIFQPAALGTSLRWASRRAKKKKKGTPREDPFEREQRLKKLKWSRLAVPAKHKRVLSLCDFWFGKVNMVSDAYILESLCLHNGWMPVANLMTFPKMQGWVEAHVVLDALSGTGGEKKYETRMDVFGDGACFRPRKFGAHFNALMREEATSRDLEVGEILQRVREDPELVDCDDLSDAELRVLYGALFDPVAQQRADLQREELAEWADEELPGLFPGGDTRWWEDCMEEPEDGGALPLAEPIEAQPRAALLDAVNALLEQDDAEIADGADELQSTLRERQLARVVNLAVWRYSSSSGGQAPSSGEAARTVTARALSSRPIFKFDGPLKVVDSVAGLNKFCARVLEGLPGSLSPPSSGAAEPEAAGPLSGRVAIGFDVEYATLEEDLRQLPALLTLCSAEAAALVRLDRLAEHGRSALAHSQPLARLLDEPRVLKVGVGARYDAANLLRWFVSPAAVRGVVDLGALSLAGLADGEDGGEEGSEEAAEPSEWPHELSHVASYVEGGAYEPRSLAEWCDCVLQRSLPKRKHKGKKGGKSSKRAHWRAPTLTAQMRRYATDDAAAALEVWNALRRLPPPMLLRLTAGNAPKSSAQPSEVVLSRSDLFDEAGRSGRPVEGEEL